MVEQRKPVSWRVLAVFASGLLLGGGIAAWVLLQPRSAAAPASSTAPAAQVVKASVPAAKTAPAPAAAAAAAHAHVACPAGPVVVAAGRNDGLARLQSEPRTAGDIAALILSGKEAAAAGRPRDAEILFLAACRGADQLERADATESTDARYQLARHYAHLVLVSSSPPANRAELVTRAELLYTDAGQAYRARFGESHEKTKFAAEGLAALRQSFAQAVPVAEKPAPAAAKAAPAPRAVVAVEPAAPVIARPSIQPELPKPAIAAAPPPPRPPAVEVVTAPVRQATGAANRPQDDADDVQ